MTRSLVLRVLGFGSLLFMVPPLVTAQIDVDFDASPKREDMQQWLSTSALSEDRARSILAAYDEWSKSFETARNSAAERHQRILTRYKDSADVSSLEVAQGEIEIVKLQTSWRARREELLAQCEDTIGEQLASDQLESWKREMRRSRRQRLMPELLAWKSLESRPIDLIEICTSLDWLQANKDVASILAEYEMELDALLKAWGVDGMRAQADLFVAAKTSRFEELAGTVNPRTYHNFIEARTKLQEMSKTASNLCDTYFSRIMAVLQADESHEFQLALEARQFPELTMMSPPEIVVLVLEDRINDPDLLAAIHGIYAAYCTRDAELRLRLLRSIHDQNSPRSLAAREQAIRELRDAGMDPWSNVYLPADDVSKARVSLVKDTCQQIKALLTEERLKDLPIRAQLLLSWTPK